MMKTKSIKAKSTITSNPVAAPVNLNRSKDNNLTLGGTIRWDEEGEATVNLIMLKMNCNKSEAIRFALRVCAATL